MSEAEYISRGTAAPALSKSWTPIYTHTPTPALVTSVPDVNALLRGAWAWVHRSLGKMVIKAEMKRLSFMLPKETLEAAIVIWREKEIPPAAWMAWTWAKKMPTRAVTLETLVNLPWLTQGQKRGWFRKDTQNLFGGRAVIVGEPPLQNADAAIVEAYLQYARQQTMRLENGMHERSIRGELFPNADVIAHCGREVKV